uniref:Uncharacterized protein n=1 Tax=Anguilla anguilla TaxID=7936 RepID=A0A0E9S665_ANGAN
MGQQHTLAVVTLATNSYENGGHCTNQKSYFES